MTVTRTTAAVSAEDCGGGTSTTTGAQLSLSKLRSVGEADSVEVNWQGAFPVTEDELALIEHWCGDLIIGLLGGSN